MATILINHVKTSPISCESNVHNKNGVDADLLNQWLNEKHKNIINETYYKEKPNGIL